MNIVCTNDWHFAKTNPVSRTTDLNDELFDFLGQVSKIARHFRADAVTVAGDLFHNKGLAPWDVIVKLLEWGRALPCPVLTIMGNHDQTHDRFESIGQTPYGALIASGVFTDISRQAISLGGVTFYGVPWPDGSRADAFKAIPDGVDVVLAHGFATIEGLEQWGVHCHKYTDLAVQQPGVRVWHFGHDHADHGIFTLPNRAMVVNLGALARGALDTETLVRQVKVGHIELLPGQQPKAQSIVLKQRPATEVFDVVRHRERKAEQAQLETFLTELQAGLNGVLDVDYTTVLAGMPLDAAVRAKVLDYIGKAEVTA
jgi:hypothetical protein